MNLPLVNELHDLRRRNGIAGSRNCVKVGDTVTIGMKLSMYSTVEVVHTY